MTYCAALCCAVPRCTSDPAPPPLEKAKPGLAAHRKSARQVAVLHGLERQLRGGVAQHLQQGPLASQLGAIASQQSRTVADRETLEQQYETTKQQFGEHPSRPEHWGGYRVIPDRIEFWQGRPSRMHDRVLYTRDANGQWQRQRLQP